MNLHELHKKYLFDHTGIDRIIEDRGLFGNYSEFVASQGGDVTVYRVYGVREAEMKIYIR